MSTKTKVALAIVVALIVLLAVVMIARPEDEKIIGQAERLVAIPADAVKITPDNDSFRPVVHSALWAQPVPMQGPVNTAGAEDSPYITWNGTWFFFFFTPDVGTPAEKQLIDGVTGIWWVKREGNSWSLPEKITLHDGVSLDGAECVVASTMWFASVRAGNYREIDVYTAQYSNGRWTSVQNVGEQLNVDYDIGEFHLMPDGSTMYFHRGNLTGPSEMGLWVTYRTSTGWSEPVEIIEINQLPSFAGYPYVTPDGQELWYTSWSRQSHIYPGPAIFRSLRQPNGTWGPPEEIISNFAGEPTLDSEGNIYFVHHYYSADLTTMIEADIYVAYRK